MIPMTAPIAPGPGSTSSPDPAAPADGFEATLAAALGAEAPASEEEAPTVLCSECAADEALVLPEDETDDSTEDAGVIAPPVVAALPAVPLQCSGCGTTAEPAAIVLPEAPSAARPTQSLIATPDPAPVAPDVVDAAPMPVPSTPAAPAAPVSAPAPLAEPGVSASIRFVERVEQVVARLEAAGPPKTMVVDLVELNGMRVTVSLRGATVHVSFAAAVANDVNGWMSDLQRNLAARGLEVTGDAPWDGEAESQGRRPDHDRTDDDQPRPNRWTWPPSTEGATNGSHLTG